MSCEEFVSNVARELYLYLPSELNDIAVWKASVPCNNNIYRTEIEILTKGMSGEYKILWNLKSFYDSFQEGIPMETVLRTIAEHIADLYKKGYFVSVQEMEYEQVKEQLLIEVRNTEMNRGQLFHMPHEEREDLALSCMLWAEAGNMTKYIRVNNAILEQWGITEEILWKDAWENMKKKFPPTVCAMRQVIKEIMDEGLKGVNNRIETLDPEDDIMYVVSNSIHCRGASYMFDLEFMGRLAEKFQDDLIILPSSVHEIIIIKRQNIAEREGLAGMVREINCTQVLPEEVLSNNVYLYDKKTGNVHIFREAVPVLNG